jgi:DNA-binding IclR family transcriptional regulator
MLLAEGNGGASLDALDSATDIPRATIRTCIARLREIGFVSSVSSSDTRGQYHLSSELCRVWVNKHLRGLADAGILSD